MEKHIPVNEMQQQAEQVPLWQKAAIFGAGIALAATLTYNSWTSNSGAEGIPCDPVIDNECVPDENGTLPTLPDKVPTTTTTEVPPTTEEPPVTPPVSEQPPTTPSSTPPSIEQPPVQPPVSLVPPAAPVPPRTK